MIFAFSVVIFSLIHVSVSAIVPEYKTYKNYKLYEITGSSNGLEELVKTLTGRYEIPFHVTEGPKTKMLIAPELVPILEEIVEKHKLSTNIIIEDYSEIIKAEKANPRSSKEFSWNAYYDIDDIYGYLQNMSKTYPNWTQLVVGGSTYEGRQILGLRINTPTQDDEAKPVMFIESGIHAREWITPATTTYFINQLLTSSNPNITKMRDDFDWHIFPTVNPDGYHYSYTVDRMWRKTRSKSSSGCYGADPNRNWDYNWLQFGATDDSCDYQTYGGANAFSEVETRTLSNYISGLENMLGYIGFHSDAQCLLVPYSDSSEHTDNYDDLIKIGKTSLQYGYEVNKAEYDGPATAAEILYKASGGSMDWVRHALGTDLVYTYELRGYYFHWPAYKIYQQGDEVTQMLHGLTTAAKDLGYY